MRKTQNICLFLFFVLPPVIFLPSFYEGYGILKEVLIWLLIPMMFTSLIINKNKLNISFPIISFGAFLILNFLLLWTIPNKYYGVERLYILLTYFSLMVFSTNVSIENKKLITIGMLIGFVTVAFIGVLQYINIIHINWEQLHWKNYFGKRVFSTLGNPNALGSYLILFLPLTTLLAIRREQKLKLQQAYKERVKKTGLFVISFVGFACLLFTNSWGSMGGFAGAIIVIIVFSVKTKIKIWKKGLYFLLLGFVVISIGFVANKRSKIFGEPTGAIARVLLVETAIHMVKDRPIIGFGPNGFIYYSNSKYLNNIEISPKYNDLWHAMPNLILRNPGYPENEYLNSLVDTGIVGLAIFIWFIISIFRFLGRRIDSASGNDKIFMLGITAGIVALLVDGFFDIPFSEWYVVGAMFFVMVGFVSDKKEVKIPKAIIITFVVVVSIVFLSKAVRTAVSGAYLTKAEAAGLRKENNLEAEYYKKSIKVDVLTHMVFSNLGKLAYEEQQYEDAKMWYKKSIELLPFHEALHFCLGGVYYKMGDFARAESSFVYAIQLEPRYSASYAKLASIYRKEKKYDEAEKVILQSMKYLSADAAIGNELGIIYAEKGDKKQALNALEKALVLSKYDPVIWYNIFLAQEKTTEQNKQENNNVKFIDLVEFEFLSGTLGKKQTEASVRELLSLYPDYPDALLLYAQAMIKKGNKQEAVCAFKKALYIAPSLSIKMGKPLNYLLKTPDIIEKAQNLFVSASQNYARKDFEKAEKDLLNAVEILPSFASAYYNLGILLSEKGDYDNAVLAWHKFIALDPTNKDIPKIRVEISKLMSKK